MDTWCGLPSCSLGALVNGYQTLLAALIALVSVAVAWHIERGKRRDEAQQEAQRQKVIARLLRHRMLGMCQRVYDHVLRVRNAAESLYQLRNIRDNVRGELDAIIDIGQGAMDDCWKLTPEVAPVDLDAIVANMIKLQYVLHMVRGLRLDLEEEGFFVWFATEETLALNMDIFYWELMAALIDVDASVPLLLPHWETEFVNRRSALRGAEPSTEPARQHWD